MRSCVRHLLCYKNKYRLLHGKSTRTTFIHEVQMMCYKMRFMMQQFYDATQRVDENGTKHFP